MALKDQYLGTKEPHATSPFEKHLVAHLQQVEGCTKTGVTGLNGDRDINATEYGQMAGEW